jgi:hypothetical protein
MRVRERAAINQDEQVKILSRLRGSIPMQAQFELGEWECANPKEAVEGGTAGATVDVQCFRSALPTSSARAESFRSLGLSGLAHLLGYTSPHPTHNTHPAHRRGSSLLLLTDTGSLRDPWPARSPSSPVLWFWHFFFPTPFPRLLESSSAFLPRSLKGHHDPSIIRINHTRFSPIALQV